MQLTRPRVRLRLDAELLNLVALARFDSWRPLRSRKVGVGSNRGRARICSAARVNGERAPSRGVARSSLSVVRRTRSNGRLTSAPLAE